MLASWSAVTLDLVPHCSSVPRDAWQDDDGLRPLSDAGTTQAALLGEVLAPGADAVYSSPALRCRQTVAPLAAAAGVPVVPDDRLRESEGFSEPTAWTQGTFAPIGSALGGAWAAGRAMGVLAEAAGNHHGGRAVVCSHGDVIPALLVHLAAAHRCALPDIVAHGSWYRLELADGRLSMTGLGPHSAI
ncbi:histidine phosphatase family protein [Streptomyces sp. NPDC052095]|uniref:histidine phosphatase family protein n=1 Tax=unclassified Streptomyces TaxID=2593676 RepID=UPI00344FBA21